MEVLSRMRDGRFRVAAHLQMWWDEMRGYHRKDGIVVKINDDLMSATFKAIMALRFAKSAEMSTRIQRRRIDPAGNMSIFEPDPFAGYGAE